MARRSKRTAAKKKKAVTPPPPPAEEEEEEEEATQTTTEDQPEEVEKEATPIVVDAEEEEKEEATSAPSTTSTTEQEGGSSDKDSESNKKRKRGDENDNHETETATTTTTTTASDDTTETPTASTSSAPLLMNKTLYINNLNEKVKKHDLKKSLYMMFAPYGQILEVHASRSAKRRGQAWIAFKTHSGATAAMEKMQGFSFYEKPMKIAYSTNKSDAHAKIDGTITTQLEIRAVARAKLNGVREGTQPVQKKQKKSHDSSGGLLKKKKIRNPAIRKRPEESLQSLPNKILFVQNLPGGQGVKRMLEVLFQNFTGFVEVSLVPNKEDIAFVEFETEILSGLAMQGLQGFKLSKEHAMKITFAKM